MSWFRRRGGPNADYINLLERQTYGESASLRVSRSLLGGFTSYGENALSNKMYRRDRGGRVRLDDVDPPYPLYVNSSEVSVASATINGQVYLPITPAGAKPREYLNKITFAQFDEEEKPYIYTAALEHELTDDWSGTFTLQVGGEELMSFPYAFDPLIEGYQKLVVDGLILELFEPRSHFITSYTIQSSTGAAVEVVTEVPTYLANTRYKCLLSSLATPPPNTSNFIYWELNYHWDYGAHNPVISDPPAAGDSTIQVLTLSSEGEERIRYRIAYVFNSEGGLSISNYRDYTAESGSAWVVADGFVSGTTVFTMTGGQGSSVGYPEQITRTLTTDLDVGAVEPGPCTHIANPFKGVRYSRPLRVRMTMTTPIQPINDDRAEWRFLFYGNVFEFKNQINEGATEIGVAFVKYYNLDGSLIQQEQHPIRIYIFDFRESVTVWIRAAGASLFYHPKVHFDDSLDVVSSGQTIIEDMPPYLFRIGENGVFNVEPVSY